MCSYKTVTVIGAGASGLMAAITAAEQGAFVTLIEGNQKLGRKLYATGNGRCNFTNIYCSASDYNDVRDGFVETVLSRFTAEDCLRFFEKLALFARVEDEGRCYPYNNQAASLVDVLERAVLHRGIKVRTEDAAVQLERIASEDGGYKVTCASGYEVESEAVILACGGRAGLQFGSTGDGYGFAKAMGHTLVPPRPALVAVEASVEHENLMRELKGLRAKGKLSLYEDGVYKEGSSGEIQFTGTGISGICMFDLSRFMKAARPSAVRSKRRKLGKSQNVKALSVERAVHTYEVGVDFVPEMNETELARMILRFAQDICGEFGLADVLGGIVDRRVAYEIAHNIFEFSEDAAIDAARKLKDFRISVSNTKGWEAAQVTVGGIRRSEISPESMQSRLASGLYFCGELVDVDGRCGGFNLQWAWASGHLAGKLL